MKTLFSKIKVLVVALIITNISFSSAQKIIGYIPQYRTTAQMDAAIEWDKMTDYYYFGSLPTTSGGITLEQSARFDHVKNKATTYGKNVWLSCGGWGKSAAFITVANSASLSQTFADEALSLCQTHGLTGIDIDWEFPAYGQETAFKNFFKTLYETLNPAGFKVSAAAGGEAAHADKWQADVFNYIDDLNIMSYDAGAGYSNHASLQFMKDAMTLYNTQGCPYSKMLGGVAFYSRCAAVKMYSEIVNAESGEVNKQAAFENDLTNGYCYNGKNTIEAKINYVMGQGGIGVLIWEVTQDVLGTYSLLGATDAAMDVHRCAAPAPSLGNDQSICGTSSITLNGGVSQQSGVTFTWKKGATSVVSGSATANTYAATSTGTYTLEVWQGGCSRSDEIEITGVLNAVDLGGPYDLCSPVSVTLNSGVTGGGKTFVWEKNSSVISGETSSTYLAKTAGAFKVTVSASGCSSVNASATVTSSVPSATNDTVCNGGDQATITASESVNWYSSSVSATVLATGSTYQPSPSSTTTYYMGGTGAASVSHTTMKTAFTGGWQANSQVYASKLIIAADLTIDEVYVNAEGGTVVVNLVGSDGTTVVKTKTFNSVSGEVALNLGWTAIAAGTYYLNAVGTTGNLWVDNSANGSDHVVSGVITVEKQCYADWSAPYGDAYVASANYGTFFKLKVTVGSSCERVPVDVVIDGTVASCIVSSSKSVVQSKMSIYPNPSNNQFQVCNAGTGMVTVIDALGIVVEQFMLNDGTRFFGSLLLQGVYFVKVESKSGVKTLKIIKR
jgi:hypothetical protein